MRRRHGGTAPGNVFVGSAAAVIRVTGTVDGINVSAGRGNLGLHRQRARNAEGGEVRQFGKVTQRNRLGHVRNFNGTGVISIAAGGSGRHGIRFHPIRVCQRNGNHREGAGISIQIHVDGTVLIIRNDQRLGVVAFQIVALFIEGQLAAVDDDHLTGKADGPVDGGILSGITHAVNVNVIPRSGNGRHRGTGGTAGVNNLTSVVENKRHTGGSRVLGSGNAEGVDEGSGRTAGVKRNIRRVDAVMVLKERIPRIGVARGNADDGLHVFAAIREIIHNGLVGRGL